MHSLSWVTVFFLLGTGTAFSKDLGKFSSADGAWELSLANVPQTALDHGLELNKLSTLTAKISAKDPAKTAALTAPTFEARMPAHHHGMMVNPRVSTVGPGDYRIDGVKLHMQGTWELSLAVMANGQTVKFILPIVMPGTL